MNTTIVPVIDLPFLAREINDAHRQVVFHGKSMLMEAKRAGEALIEAKKQCGHGNFIPWLTKELKLLERTARLYMQVAKKWAGNRQPIADLEGVTIADFLGWTKPEPEAPREFTREDAERTLKLHALAERGATDGSRRRHRPSSRGSRRNSD